MPTRFPFNDLHSFKDYVGFVALCAPDLFPVREGVSAEDQWTLELAFKGLRAGLDLSIREKGNRPQFERARQLFDAALASYCTSDVHGGYRSLDEAKKLLGEIRT